MSLDLNKEYDNGARVPELPQILQQWQVDSVAYRNNANARLDLAYGEHDRQKVDTFGIDPKVKSALVVFIHGGYWRMLGHEAFSHFSQGLNDQGLGVLVPSYQLCPDVAINDIITDLRLLCAWAWRTYERKLVVTGHSAGGHLAAAMVATDWKEFDLPADLVVAGLGISGLYDLRPLMATKLNETLQLDEPAARAASPLLWPTPIGKRFQAWVGRDESDEFKRQSDTIAACWSGAGAPTTSVHVPNKNHFTVIDDLRDADSEMTKAIAAMAKVK
jgi:arylformamidase